MLLSKMYRRLSWALPIFPKEVVEFGGGILNVSAANMFLRACHEWRKIR